MENKNNARIISVGDGKVYRNISEIMKQCFNGKKKPGSYKSIDRTYGLSNGCRVWLIKIATWDEAKGEYMPPNGDKITDVPSDEGHTITETLQEEGEHGENILRDYSCPLYAFVLEKADKAHGKEKGYRFFGLFLKDEKKSIKYDKEKLIKTKVIYHRISDRADLGENVEAV